MRKASSKYQHYPATARATQWRYDSPSQLYRDHSCLGVSIWQKQNYSFDSGLIGDLGVDQRAFRWERCFLSFLSLFFRQIAQCTVPQFNSLSRSQFFSLLWLMAALTLAHDNLFRWIPPLRPFIIFVSETPHVFLGSPFGLDLIFLGGFFLRGDQNEGRDCSIPFPFRTLTPSRWIPVSHS